eukprot:gb/GECG01000507.1/.p1 GENE.gb/GECG01000507.1/~~gb/GECG01000507.1/.p1  ORF type:complete len:131 (+),score=22.89 gb/GECG01000507.1/:1-393(+)
MEEKSFDSLPEIGTGGSSGLMELESDSYLHSGGLGNTFGTHDGGIPPRSQRAPSGTKRRSTEKKYRKNPNQQEQNLSVSPEVMEAIQQAVQQQLQTSKPAASAELSKRVRTTWYPFVCHNHGVLPFPNLR